jgi:hypothetical protein
MLEPKGHTAMRFDVFRIHHLRRIANDRRAAYRAAADDRHDQRERLQTMQRERQRIEHAYGATREPEALADLDRRIAATADDLKAAQDREAELAAASSTAAQTLKTALDFAQEAGLDLPDDLKPRSYGAAAHPAQEGT